uniref:7TM_GPCR_Srx domain-containing protein n=1 Tax=Ascaris lumbricoides TaxID=6252 RepID=A0A0M3IJX2_ASCLU
LKICLKENITFEPLSYKINASPNYYWFLLLSYGISPRSAIISWCRFSFLIQRYTRMSCIQLTVRARNQTTPQYFTCFGRLHVKEAVLIIIIGTFMWDTLRWTSFLLQQNIIGG